MVRPNSQDEIIDHILNFDPEDPTTALSVSSIQPALLAPQTLPAIPWPAKAAPKSKPRSKKPTADSALPEANVLVVTWTVAEALALSDVLTPGYRSKTDWYPYAHNWKKHFKPLVKKGAPSLKSDRLGSWFVTRVKSNNVICYKSELHLARDGPRLPVKDLWSQLIAEVKPSLVITTGTAGAIGKNVLLGDVVMSKKVRFDCARTFKKAAFSQSEFRCTKSIPLGKVSFANSQLLGVTAGRLPESARQPKIVTRTPADNKAIDVVTTDFFAFDDTTDHFQLQKLGSAVEMGDAVLGLVCEEMGTKAPAWIAVRNASDPQIDGSLPLKQQVEQAGRIYEKYGYWTTVNSAIGCWSIIAS